MIRIYILLIFSLYAYNISIFPQANVSPLQGKLQLSINGAVIIPKTDFRNSVPTPAGIGAVDYFFGIKSRHTLGIRLYGGIGVLEGMDTNRNPYEYSDDIFFFGGGLTYGFALDKTFVPYLFFGAANLWYNPVDNNNNPIITGKPASENLSAVSYDYEIGLKIFLTEGTSLNLSGGGFQCMTDNLDGIRTGNYDDIFFYGKAGISVSFLGYADSDKDGVRDSQDACPNTPPGVKVDLFGCPLDSDKDGIPDYLDKCTDTPPGVKVDAYGCPLDTDNDGVPDYKDKCAGTPFGIKVDANGCPEEINKNSFPDSLEKKTPLKPKPESLKYNSQNEYLVGEMIYTDGNLYIIQISAWRTSSKAETEADKLRMEGYDAFVDIKFIDKLNETWYRVRIGYFNTFREAHDIAETLK